MNNAAASVPDEGGVRAFGASLRTYTVTNGLSNNSVWALHEDSAGVLWIGTERGLNRLQNGRFTAFTRENGLPNDLVNFILEDDSGHLWISHDLGIYRVAKQALNDVAMGKAHTIECVSYDEADGLASVETNGQKSQPAGLRTRDGRLWFASVKGVVMIDPRQPPDITNAPTVLIEQIRPTAR